MTTQTQNPAYRPALPPLLSAPAHGAEPIPRIWALADTHLGFGVGKTMDRFGPAWENHAARFKANAEALIAAEDVLLIPGDLSWATRRREAQPDLEFLTALPGRKIVIKGNHDYWWESGKPVNFPGLESPPVVLAGGAIGIAGTRGWFEPERGDEDAEAARRILERERARLQSGLAALSGCSVRIALLHYPPHPYLADLRAAAVDIALYGHVHLGSLPHEEPLAVEDAVIEGVRCCCVAGDRLAWAPKRIL
jgi:predicted phosphohydrolase